MLLFRTPVRRFGRPGVLPANMPTAGSGSPLLNDVSSPADDNSEWLWTLLTPLIDASSGGTTDVDDTGGYQHVGASNVGTYTQSYRGLVMPPSGVTTVYTADITITVGSGAAVSSLTSATALSTVAGTQNHVGAVASATVSTALSTVVGEQVGEGVSPTTTGQDGASTKRRRRIYAGTPSKREEPQEAPQPLPPQPAPVVAQAEAPAVAAPTPQPAPAVAKPAPAVRFAEAPAVAVDVSVIATQIADIEQRQAEQERRRRVERNNRAAMAAAELLLMQ